MRFTLYIGNKNYSSWSMRPWVLMKEAGIAFTEQKLRFDSFEKNSEFKQSVEAVSTIGKVPVLVDHEMADGLAITDSLAICEYLAEQFPEKQLWPQDTAARAQASSVCAQIHSGFPALRNSLPMNIEAFLPEAGQIVLRDRPEVDKEIEQIVQMWSKFLNQYGGSMLFGDFSIADVFYAPVCMRFRTYCIPLPTEIKSYMDNVCLLPNVARWISDACRENDFCTFQEPYRAEA